MNGEKIKSFGKVFWGPVVIVCGVSFFLDLGDFQQSYQLMVLLILLNLILRIVLEGF